MLPLPTRSRYSEQDQRKLGVSVLLSGYVRQRPCRRSPDLTVTSMCNAVHEDLVDRGIVREWNEDRDLRRCSTTLPSNLEEELQREGLQLHVKDTGDEVFDDLIISDDQNSWHSERGSERYPPLSSSFALSVISMLISFPPISATSSWVHSRRWRTTNTTRYCTKSISTTRVPSPHPIQLTSAG